jgi:hypothetical protein
MAISNTRRSTLLSILVQLPLIALWTGCGARPEATAAGGTSGAARQGPGADLAITGVAVVDVAAGRVVPDRTVLIDGDSIRAVVPEGSDLAAAQTVDGRGAFLMPGLWDMHAHVRGDGLPEWVTTEWMMPLILAHGVTGVREMSSDCSDPDDGPVCLARMKELQAEVETGQRIGPRLLALSSFQVNPPWDYEVTEEQARGLVAVYDEKGADFIKVYHRLSPEAFRWIADEAGARGLDVAGHVPLRMTAAESAGEGLRSVEHARDLLFDCFPGTAEFRRTSRSLDPPTDVRRAMVEEHDPEQCDAAFRTLVAHDTWYVPTHVTRRMDALADDSTFRNDPRSMWLPPAMWEAWNADADRMVALDPSPRGRAVMRGFYRKGLEITGAAHAAGVRVLVGTDGGDSFVFPGAAVHDELGELVKAGLSPAEALRAATLRPAEFLGLTGDYGTVEPGKRADLVLLDANPLEDIAHTRRIRAVVLGGRVLDRDRLDAMLREVESAAARPLQP